MLILQDITYIHPNGDLLFTDINLSINKQEKVALIGNNGAGKSILLKILSGNLIPSAGHGKVEGSTYYVPQVFGQFNGYTIAEALQIADKINGLNEILNGNVTDEHLNALDDDWTIEERCREAFSHWKLNDLALTQKMETLSGGQKTKVFLAGIMIHRPDTVLLDEPSNHLDSWSRALLYHYVKSTKNTLIIVSHDRALLNLLSTVYKLSKSGITAYGGNYDFYATQKLLENENLYQELKTKEKALRKAKEVEKHAVERQQKLDARGKKKQEKAGLPTISMNTLRNNAEKSTSKIKGVHAEKVGAITEELTQLRSSLPDIDKMKIDLNSSILHKGKNLVNIREVNFKYTDQFLWPAPISLEIYSGERIVIKGANGSGKTTLIKMILKTLQPACGTITCADFKAIYIDQDYSLIDNTLSVYEQAERYNSGVLQEHEIKIRLNRFLFTKADWNKGCNELSGGEKMRLMLCALTIGDQAPDLMIMDEPTNNLDIQNIEILTNAINSYQGTLLMISHDEYFLKQINAGRVIDLM